MTDEKTPPPWRTAPLLREAAHGPLFTVRYRVEEYHATFDLFECVGTDLSEGFLYARTGAVHGGDTTSDLDKAESCMRGMIKWDGCSHVEYPATTDCMQHLCGRHDWDRWGRVMLALYDEVAPKIPKYNPEVAK